MTPNPTPTDEEAPTTPAGTGTSAGSDPGGGGPRSSDRSPVLVLAISLAVVFGLLAAGLGVLALGGDDEGSAGPDELRRTAGEAAVALFTWDHQDPEAHRDRILALSTGSFRSTYEDGFEQGIAKLITQAQSTAEGFVKDVFITAIDEERAEAIVVTDVTRDGAGGPRTVFDIYTRFSFVRVDGTWKVDQVTDLNFESTVLGGGGTGSETDGATSTSTPVP